MKAGETFMLNSTYFRNENIEIQGKTFGKYHNFATIFTFTSIHENMEPAWLTNRTVSNSLCILYTQREKGPNLYLWLFTKGIRAQNMTCTPPGTLYFGDIALLVIMIIVEYHWSITRNMLISTLGSIQEKGPLWVNGWSKGQSSVAALLQSGRLCESSWSNLDNVGVCDSMSVFVWGPLLYCFTWIAHMLFTKLSASITITTNHLVIHSERSSTALAL